MGMSADAEAAAAGRDPGPHRDRPLRASYRNAGILREMTAVLITIQMLAFVLWLLLIAEVVLSWTNPMGGGGLRPSCTRSPS